MKTNPTNGNYVVIGHTRSYDVNREFPTFPGSATTSIVPAAGTLGSYMTAVMFNGLGVRLCANIFGGGNSDYFPQDLVINPTNSDVTIIGNTGNTLPTTTPANLTAGTYSNTKGQGFVVQFGQLGTSQSLNVVKWKSRLNGFATGIAMKPNTKEIYITSATTTGTLYPTDLMTNSNANAYNKTLTTSKYYFQISKFDALGVRKWATHFPVFSTAFSFGANVTNLFNSPALGYYNESILKCHIDADNYGFTIAGEARDTGLVIFNKYNVPMDSTFNDVTSTTASDGFVTRFNSNDSLVFSQYIGGSKSDGYHDIKYSNPNEILLTGYSRSPEYKNLTYRSSSTQYIDTVMPTGAVKMLITKIDSIGNKKWSTFYGNGTGTAWQTALGWSITNDPAGKVYITGVTTLNEFKIATSNAGTVYNKTSQLNLLTGGVTGSSDAFLLGINETNNIIWNTYFGGGYDDCGLGIEFNTNSNKLMITGVTNTGNAGTSLANKFPTTYATFNSAVWYKEALNASSGNTQLLAGHSDGYIGWFDISSLVGIKEYFNSNTNNEAFALYPNPSNSESYLAFKNKLEGKTTIEIYSINGQLLFSDTKQSIMDYAVITLPTANLSSGVYIVAVKNAGNTIAKKLIISK